MPAEAGLGTLVVDDEPLAVERMQLLCAEAPEMHLVGTAHDGEAALRLIEALSPGLVLLDVSMPGWTASRWPMRWNATRRARPWYSAPPTTSTPCPPSTWRRSTIY